MAPVKFAAYIEVEGTNITSQQIVEAVIDGLSTLFMGDAGVTYDVQAYRVPSREEWQPGHMNTLTAASQRKEDG